MKVFILRWNPEYFNPDKLTYLYDHSPLMVKYGIMKKYNILKLKNYLHFSIDKSLMEGSITISKIEQNCLMIIIHVSKMNAINFIFITEYNSLFQCTIIQHLRIILLMN